MTVTRVREVGGDGGKWAITVSKTGVTGATEYTRNFQVTVDDPSDSAWVVAQAVDPDDSSYFIPQVFDPHPDDPTSFVRSITPKRHGSSFLHWEVQIEYSSDVDPADDNPLNKPPDISFGGEKFTRPFFTDIYGSPITNSAGDPFDPPIEGDDSRPQLTIVRNQAVFDPGVSITYQDAVNSTTFAVAAPGFALSVAAGIAKIDDISGNSQFENNIYFWKVTYKLAFRREGWLPTPVDAGYHKLEDGKRYLILDDKQERVSEPVLLDGHGGEAIRRFPITAVAAGSFTTPGDQTSVIGAGATAFVAGATLASGETNDGSYTVSSSSFADGVTTINVTPATTHTTAQGTIGVGNVGILRYQIYKILNFNALGLP